LGAGGVYLGSDLVAALASLDVDDLSHFEVDLGELERQEGGGVAVVVDVDGAGGGADDAASLNRLVDGSSAVRNNLEARPHEIKGLWQCDQKVFFQHGSWHIRLSFLRLSD
jgi:hypothetical protein